MQRKGPELAAGLRGIVEQAGPPPDGSEGGTLRHSAGPWGAASRVARALAGGVGASLTGMDRAHSGIAGTSRGLESIAALGAVHSSWEVRLRDLRRECEALERALAGVAPVHAANEGRVRSSFDGVAS